MSRVAEKTVGYEMNSGFKQTELGPIPVEWDFPLLDRVANRGSGHTPDKKHPEYWGGPIKWVSLQDTQRLDRGLIGTTAASITSLGLANSSAVIHHSGTVILSRDAGVGKSAILAEDMAVSQHFMAWRCSSAINNWFLYYWLQKTKPEFERIAMGNTIKTIGLPFFRRFRVPIPTLTEQKAIASALSNADALIESLEQLLAKKRLIKQGAMQELLTGDWPSKAFGDLFKFSGGYSASRNDLGSNGHLYLHYGDIHGSDRTFVDVEADGGDIPRIDIPLSEVSPASLLDDGDVVFVDASEDVDGTNKHVVIDNPEARPFISGLHTIVAKRKTNEINPRYMRYCFQTPEIKEQFRFYAVGTKVSGVSKTSIAKIVLAVPSPHEQSEIAATLDTMEHEIELVIERLAKARQLKQAMMQQLLTGRIRLV